MDPANLASFSIGSSAGGSLLSALGSLNAGNARADMYSYRAGMAQLREKIALRNRDYAHEQGEDQLIRYGMKAKDVGSRIEATQAASGVDIGRGSPVQVRAGHRRVTEIDMRTIADNAARRAYGFETEAAYAEAEAGLYTRASKDARSAGKMAFATSLLSGVTSVSDKWLKASQSGILGSDAEVLGTSKHELTHYDYGY